MDADGKDGQGASGTGATTKVDEAPRASVGKAKVKRQKAKARQRALDIADPLRGLML